MRRIIEAKITHLSLVKRGANRLPVIYKSDAAKDNIDIDMLVKASADFDEKGELIAVVYAPELRDTQGDIASQDVIRKAMHDAMKTGIKIDMSHDGKELTKDQVYVAESFEIQKGDPRFADMKDRDGNAVDVTGGWGVVMKITDPAVRKLYRDKTWEGVSMLGDGKVVMEKADTVDLFFDRLGKLLKTNEPSTGELDMNEADLKKVLDERDDKLTKSITAALKDVLKPEAPADEAEDIGVDKPVLAAGFTKSDLQQYTFDSRRYDIAKSVYDAQKTKDAKKIAAAIAKADKDLEALDADIEKAEKAAKKNGKGKAALEKGDEGDDENADRIAELEEQLATLRKSSNQVDDDEDGDEGDEGANRNRRVVNRGERSSFSKEDRDLIQSARDTYKKHGRKIPQPAER